MARRYPKYDWSGIAMLTQQVGQLFEPSKARLMSQQQEHEMNMLLAKKTWDVESENLKTLRTQHKSLLGRVDAEIKKTGELGLDVQNAAISAYGNPAESLEVHDKNDGGIVRNLSEQSHVLANSIVDQQKLLDDIEGMNLHGIAGKSWSDTFGSPRTEKGKHKDYKADYDVDGSGTLNWNEQNKAVRSYISDYYTVPEGEEGISLNIGSEVVDNVKPEALAFLAGFQSTRGRDKVDMVEAQVSNLKTPDDYINTMIQAKEILDDYERKGMTADALATLSKGELLPGFTNPQHIEFDAAHDIYKEAYKAHIKAGGKVPDDLKDFAPVSPSMFIAEKGYVFDTKKKFAKEGLDYEKYAEIQRSENPDHNTYKTMASQIVYEWDYIISAASDPKATDAAKKEKNSMLEALEILKKEFNF